MENDRENKYRDLLEEYEPDFQNRVDTPWDVNIPDVISHNDSSYQSIERQLRRLTKKTDVNQHAPSKGVLVLGEAGTGKTHLLMRVAYLLGSSNHIMFVRKPSNENAVITHIWENMLESLTKKIPHDNGKVSQLDNLLAHVFSAIMIPVLEKDISQNKDIVRKKKWLDLLIESPTNIFSMLGKGEAWHQNMHNIRRKTLTYFSENEPDVDQKIVKALITYCFLSSNSKNTILTWLKGLQIEQGLAVQLGLAPTWIDIDDDTDTSVRQQNEEQALRAIRTVGILAKYYKPLILAFDQLEGFRDQRNITLKWGDAVREIFTTTPNLVIITCLFPDFWELWLKKELDGSCLERISQIETSLDTFNEDIARNVLALRMKTCYRELQLPNEIYPFTPEDIALLCEKNPTVRSFLKSASDRFDKWLDEDPSVIDDEKGQQKPSPDDKNKEKNKSREQLCYEAIQELLEKKLRDYSVTPKSSRTNEEVFFGVVKDFLLQLLRYTGCNYSCKQGKCDNLVMPPNALIEIRSEKKNLCLAICNRIGFPLTSRLNNFLSYTKAVKNPLVVLLRDHSFKEPQGLALEHLKKIEKTGYHIKITTNEINYLYALSDMLIAVEQKEILIENTNLTKTEFFQIIIAYKFLLKSKLYSVLIDQEHLVFFKTLHKNIESKNKTSKNEHNTQNEIVSTPQKNKAYYMRSVEINDFCPDDFDNAAIAIAQEYLHEDIFREVHCTHATQIEERNGQKIYELVLSAPLLIGWTLEGSLVYCFDEELSDEYRWYGEIVEGVPDQCKIYVLSSYNITSPCYFYIRPFDFLRSIYTIYNEESYQKIARKILPGLLHVSKGNCHPKISSKASYYGLPSLEKLWNYSWSIIWGPPGTGKTYTIGEQVAQCMGNSEERFLLVSTTNKATDKLALAVAESLRKRSLEHKLDKVIRTGKGVNYNFFTSGLGNIVDNNSQDIHYQIYHVEKSLCRSNSKEERAKLKATLKDLRFNLIDRSLQVFQNKKYQVVVTTVFNAISMLTKKEIYEPLANNKTIFTTVIVDEAGVISRAATAILAMFSGQRTVLVGDPKQLSPITKIYRLLESEHAMWLAQSALNHLCISEKNVELHPAVHMLTKQYRMHPEIGDVVSEYQYSKKLTHSEEVTQRENYCELANLPRTLWYVIDDSIKETTEIKSRRSEKGTSWLRPCTEKIMNLIFAAFPFFSNSSGLFIAPFVAQIEAINNYFGIEGLDSWRAATVHSQQGIEEEIVIIDTVYAGSTAWSPQEWQRLINVAISRAKECVILISSREEMQQPFLAPLTKLMTPFVVEKKRGVYQWKEVSAQIEYYIHQEIRENPHLLGNQLQTRKNLRPILSYEQQRLCELSIDGKPRLVRGVAGSGKTVVLAHWLVKSLLQDPYKKIWVVYANASLKNLIYNSLNSAWRQIQKRDIPLDQVEVVHIKDVLKETLQYLSIRYNKEAYDYDKQAKLCLEKKNKLRILCDELFIDEAQDLGPNTLALLFELVKRNYETNECSVMIFYDNAQNLYDRKTPKWKDFGIDLRGRSTIMKESFRSTKPICEFSLNVLYQLDSSCLDVDHQEMEKQGLIKKIEKKEQPWWQVHFNKVQGPLPKYIPLENISAQMNKIADQIIKWVKIEGVKPGDIKILYNGQYIKETLLRTLSPVLSPINVRIVWQTSGEFTEREDTIVITTPHSFKGYDAEIIVVAGVDQFASKNAIFARSLYVAMTRARSILYVYGKESQKNDHKKQLIDVLKNCANLL